MARNNQLVVQRAQAALEQMKYEVAQELGISFQADGYNGNLLSRDAGRIGGNITRRLVQMAEQQLSQGFNDSYSLEYMTTKESEGGGGTGGRGSDIAEAYGRFTNGGNKYGGR
ncbi:small acid-soluble spore protein alpha/beta type [Cohnella phaseoli]|uniref:Small acid-soluble spore protein alpha/beta type n=1 Tax=Cohnella phaseoli TaxID=456490 RepID=A0A3D9KJK5_9BACL|nr:small acid-soluble spore protein alpha/beta type [Cohnella phaseoli]